MKQIFKMSFDLGFRVLCWLRKLKILKLLFPLAA